MSLRWRGWRGLAKRVLVSTVLLIGIGLPTQAERVPADGVIARGDALYDATWTIPTLGIAPLDEIQWDWSKTLGGHWGETFGFDYITDKLTDLMNKAIDYVKDVCEAGDVPCDLCGLLDILAFKPSLEFGADLSGSVVVGFAVTPPAVRFGDLRSSATSGFTVPVNATIVGPEAMRRPGDAVVLSLNLTGVEPHAALRNGEADGGHVELHGSIAANASLTTPINTFGVDVPAEASSFNFEAGAGTGAYEIKDSGVSITIGDLDLTEAQLTSSEITTSDGPLYRISADLDKIAVILAGKYCTKKIDDPEVPAEDKETYKAIQKILEKLDSSEGMTFKFDEYGVSFTLDVVKAQLDVDANVDRKVEVGSVNPEHITYTFDVPVEFEGELVTQVTTTAPSVLSYESWRAQYGGSLAEYLVYVSNAQTLPAAIRIPPDTDAVAVTVTPTVAFCLNVSQELSIVPTFALSLEAGVFRDVKIGGETDWGDLWPSWPKWISCIPLPIGTCDPPVMKTVCDAYGNICDEYGNICDEYGYICDEYGYICDEYSNICENLPWPLSDVCELVCTASHWGCTASHWGCTASHWGCTASHWGCTASSQVVDPVLSNMCPVNVTLPSIPLPSFDIPDIPRLLPRIDIPIPEIPGLSLYTEARTDTLTATVDLEPFTIEILHPASISISSTGEEGSSAGESYSGPGDTVTLHVSSRTPGRVVSVQVNGRSAEISIACCREDCTPAFSCTASRVLDEQDPDGPVVFEIEYENWDTLGRRVPGYAYETTDESSVIFIKSPPEPPTGLSPSGVNWFACPHSNEPRRRCANRVVRLEWDTAYDSTGFPATAYEVRGTIRVCGTTTNFSYSTGASPSIALPEELQQDSVVEWTVRAQDRIGRWGDYAPSAEFCGVVRPSFTSVQFESTNPFDHTVATHGDEVIVAFTVDSCFGRPTARINGADGKEHEVPVQQTGAEWVARYEIPSGFPLGPVDFTIIYQKEFPDCCLEERSLPLYKLTGSSRYLKLCVIESVAPPAPEPMYPEDDAVIFSGGTDVRVSWASRYTDTPCRFRRQLELDVLMTYPDGTTRHVIYDTSSGFGFIIPADTLPSGTAVEWRVREKSPVSDRWSKYSKIRAFLYFDRLLVEVNQSPMTTDPTNIDPLVFDVEFSCEYCGVEGFDERDVVVGGTSDPTTVRVEQEADFPSVFHVHVSGMTKPGTVSVSIPAGAAHSTPYMVPNEASTSVDNVVTFDNTPPMVSVSQELIADVDAGGSFSVRVDYPFAMDTSMPPWVWFDPDVVTSGTLHFATEAWSESNTAYTATYTMMDVGESAAGVDVWGGGAHSESGLWLEPDSPALADAFSVDTENPTVVVAASAEEASGARIAFTATFSEAVDGLEVPDVVVTNGTVASLEGSDGATFVITIAPEREGHVTLQIPAGAATDLAGNGSEASNEAHVSYIMPAELEEISISTSNPSGEYCTVGDVVTVTFTADKKLSGLPEVEIGRCDANVTYQGSNTYVAACMMDSSTREGAVEFEIHGEDRFGNPVVGIETTDGSEVVFDSEPPGFDDCPDDVTTTDAEVDWDEPAAWDNGSGVASLTQTHDPGDTFPVGTTTVVYTATDNAWNTATCEFDVTVLDDDPPGFDDCPGDISTTTSTDSAVVTWTEPTAFDHGSGIASVTQTHDPGDTFPLGATTVTYTATDNAGNTATCAFDVTVIDDEPPGFDDCPGDIWEGTSTTSAAVTWTEPTAYDDGSGVASVTQTHHPGDTFPLGITTVTYTATDHAGNTATCEFDVTVEFLE